MKIVMKNLGRRGVGILKRQAGSLPYCETTTILDHNASKISCNENRNEKLGPRRRGNPEAAGWQPAVLRLMYCGLPARSARNRDLIADDPHPTAASFIRASFWARLIIFAAAAENFLWLI